MKHVSLIAAAAAVMIATPAISGDKCVPSAIITNATFMHGSVICDQTWLGRPASLWVADLATNCRELGSNKILSLIKNGISNFDRIATNDGMVAACKDLDNAIMAVESEMRGHLKK